MPDHVIEGLTVRRAHERGRTQLDWLESRHTFSFGQYRDPEYVGYRGLRVINDDRIAPAGGFGEHPHRDMEIFTWILDGALQHRDSLGHGSIIRPGDAQVMTAGSGIRHSEFNASQQDPVHLLQIWLLPARRGASPEYRERHFPEPERRDRWRLIGSPEGRDGAIRLEPDVRIHNTRLSPGAEIPWPALRYVWLHVATGAATIGPWRLDAGDGVAIEATDLPSLTGGAEGAELLLFDLA